MHTEFVFTTIGLRKVTSTGKEVLRSMTLSFLPGAKIGVIGPNGSGKSTLLRIMAGEDKDFFGEAFARKGTTIGFLPQEPELDATLDVRGNVEIGVKATRELLVQFEELSAKLGEPLDDDEMNEVMEEMGRVQEAIDHLDGWDLDRNLEVAMDALRLPPGDQDVATLSGGERRRVALCRVLLEKPQLLLLDEPTNHLDAESVAWLERHLQEYEGTVVAVTHDRYFLDHAAEWILELDRGYGRPYKGNYSEWLDQKQARLALEEKQESAKQKTLQRELEWIRMAPRARQAKGKARMNDYEQLLREDRGDRVAHGEIVIPPGARLGDKVIVAEGLRKGYGDRVLIDDLSFIIPRGAVVGIVGGNGAGKTTLFRMISGQEVPDGGQLYCGDTVELAYVDQSRSELDPDHTVWQEISGGSETIALGKREVNSRAYVGSFNFKGAEQQKPVGLLSGGERNRVHLAKLLRSGGNVLLLDEPTNDLDVDTLRSLEEAILSFAGCVLLISHDRWFLDRISTHIMAFEGDSKVVLVEGNYQDYEKDLLVRLGVDAVRPRRMKFRKLVQG
ncbi:MAG: energy-dependent translational throttle protein EttA [Polyangiaceae bacterium]|nr:energy-dependent translational throttle protein EttA [Polyangiaceae bacterium]